MNQIELQSISELPSQPNRSLLNPESRSQINKSEAVSQQPAHEGLEQLNTGFHPDMSSANSYTESYLSISFQEILKLIFNNESPQLVAAITSSVEKSLIIVKFLTLFVFVQIIAQFIDLYVTLMGDQSIKQLVIGFFCFKIISDALLMYSLYQTHYTIIEAQLINDGDVSHTIIEFLKHISKTNSPLEGFDDEQLTQAQQVANIIAQKVSTFNWLNFLVNHLNGHLYSINRIIMISQIIIFIWGNIMLVQWGFSVQDWNLISIQISLIVFSMTIGYLALLAFLCGILLVCLGIPVLILMIIWQSCSFCSTIYWTLREHYLEWKRQRFIRGLRVQLYQQVKKEIDQYECAICLSNYGNEDRVIQLPCNGHIGHLFHDDCIKIWIETCGSCPICRTRFHSQMSLNTSIPFYRNTSRESKPVKEILHDPIKSARLASRDKSTKDFYNPNRSKRKINNSFYDNRSSSQLENNVLHTYIGNAFPEKPKSDNIKYLMRIANLEKENQKLNEMAIRYKKEFEKQKQLREQTQLALEQQKNDNLVLKKLVTSHSTRLSTSTNSSSQVPSYMLALSLVE